MITVEDILTAYRETGIKPRAWVWYEIVEASDHECGCPIAVLLIHKLGRDPVRHAVCGPNPDAIVKMAVEHLKITEPQVTAIVCGFDGRDRARLDQEYYDIGRKAYVQVWRECGR